jgi:hypothetical protein
MKALGLLLLTLNVIISGCSSDGSSFYGSSTATPSLGAIFNADINVYNASMDLPVIFSGNTGDTGIIKIDYDGYKGPVIIEIVGNATAQYFDEATGQLEDFTASDSLHAILPEPRKKVGITILTELAYQLALDEGLPLTADMANEKNELIRSALAPEISDILIPPRLISSILSAGSLSNSEADIYALKLAALALVGDGDSKPALSVLQTLIADILDGTIDGQEGDVAIVDPAYTDLATDLTTALNTFVSNYGTTALQTLVSAYDAINTDLLGGSSSGCSDVTYTDADGFFLFLDGTYVATSITGGGGANQNAMEGYATVEMRFTNNGLGGSLQFFGCTVEHSCNYQIQWSPYASNLKAVDGFEKNKTETNLYFDELAGSNVSIFYEHSTCKITLEVRSVATPLNWAQAIYEPTR